MSDPTRRVLNQDEIEDLLGFNEPPRELIGFVSKNEPSIVKHLRSSRCDLQRDAADLIEAMAVFLVKKLPNDAQAKNLVHQATKGALYD